VKGFFSKYTVFFLIVIGLYVFGDHWSTQAQSISPDTVTIAKPGIVKFDWTSGNLDYKGVNVNADASDDDTDWLIYKYTWVGSNPTKVQEKQGSWTLRATYF
jgi:hypothetical protein